MDGTLRAKMAAGKGELVALLAAEEGWGQETAPPSANPPPPPDPFARLRGPRRTPWGTLAWSDPGEPAIELFGPS
jgi:hypothetical protein